MKMDLIGSCSFAGVILQRNEMVTTIVSGYPFTTTKITNERNWFFVSWKTCFQSPAVLLIINEIKCGGMTAPAFPRFFRSVVNTEFNFRFRGLWYQNHFIYTFIYQFLLFFLVFVKSNVDRVTIRWSPIYLQSAT